MMMKKKKHQHFHDFTLYDNYYETYFQSSSELLVLCWTRCVFRCWKLRNACALIIYLLRITFYHTSHVLSLLFFKFSFILLNLTISLFDLIKCSLTSHIKSKDYIENMALSNIIIHTISLYIQCRIFVLNCEWPPKLN